MSVKIIKRKLHCISIYVKQPRYCLIDLISLRLKILLILLLN